MFYILKYSNGTYRGKNGQNYSSIESAYLFSILAAATFWSGRTDTIIEVYGRNPIGFGT